MAWFWLNIPLCALIFGAVCGIPVWLVIKHPDTAALPIGGSDTAPQARPVALAAPSTVVRPALAASAEREAA
jgi:hypothetical protein